MQTKISLVRHGLVNNPQGILYGRLPGFHLGEEGRAQAAAAAEALREAPLATVYSSPQTRAVETAEAIMQYHQEIAPVRLAELLNEVYTSYEGRLLAELRRDGWDLYTGVTPPYENPPDILARVLRFLAQMRKEYAGQHVVGVTHGDPITFVILWAKGVKDLYTRHHLDQLGMADRYPMPASITTLTYKTEDPEEVPEVEYTRPY